MELKPVKSSNLESIGYDAETQELHVEFKGGGVYAYDAVTPELFAALEAAESKGSFFHNKIRKGGFAFRKLK